MAEKKSKPEKTKIEIQTRKPEKRGIFSNLETNRNKEDHPLREILNFPPETKTDSTLDIQSEQELDIQHKSDGISKSTFLGYPNSNSLDIQKNKSGYPINDDPDFQRNIVGYPDDKELDSQANSAGYPTPSNLDSNISKAPPRISKKPVVLDSNISNNISLDSQKDDKKAGWKKYERTRKGKGVFLRTSEEITKKFKQFCIEKGWDFSYGTEIAWNKIMSDLDIQSEIDLDSLIALDDRRLKMMFKSRPFIINLYLRYNLIFNEFSAGKKGKWSAKWTARDDETGARYNDVSPVIIELGILQTQLNKGFGESRIQTFKYYTDEIEKVLMSGVSDETLGHILEYHRKMWAGQTGREIDLSFLNEQK